MPAAHTLVCLSLLIAAPSLSAPRAAAKDYFPPPESQGGWRKLDSADDIRRVGGMNPAKLQELREWLLHSDNRDFAAVVIRHGHIVLEVERGANPRTDSRRVASVSKAVCATVLAIAAEKSQREKLPRRMSFDDPAFDYIPWAQPLSDPRKARITVRQLLNHTSGICPEATGAANDGSWEYVLGLSGDPRTAKLAFDPGTACGYSTHALAHAALVCETVTGQPYDKFAIDALFRPLGCEKWWFQMYDGGEKIGRHPSHGLGMPARDLARIGFCMLHGGRWNDQQIVPAWFVQETAQPTHNVTTPELRFKTPAAMYSHGWELPARLTGEAGTPSGRGIPADARYKPGSGGQLLAFVPSLDLVVARQTGSSGDWAYAEFLRLACAAVESDAGARPPAQPDATMPKTKLTIDGAAWKLNGRPTYPGAPAEGRLLNVRMVNAVFEDANERTRPAGFDADANTARFIERIPDYVAHGVRAFTINLQGGAPGYEGALNSAFRPDGSLRPEYLQRVRRVIEACDRHGAAVILGCYYQRQDQILRDDDAVRRGVIQTARWIQDNRWEHVLLEIANEFSHGGFDRRSLKTGAGVAGLIAAARQAAPGLLVSASELGDGRLPDEVARAADFLLVHFNTTPPREIPARIAALRKYGKPIVCNEDDKIGAEGAKAAELCVAEGASWGFMHIRANQYYPWKFTGADDDPAVYATLKRLATPVK